MLPALLPLIFLGGGTVAAMLAAPRLPRLSRALAAAAILWAGLAILGRIEAPATASALLADDPLARAAGLLVCLAAGGCLAFLRRDPVAGEAPALLLLATLGGVVLAGATHAASLFLGLELVTLALVALFVLPRTRPALEAGYKFLILGAAGAASLLMGLALIHAATGRMELAALGAPGMLVSLGVALVLAGLGFKAALVPFHMWTPDAFSGAPRAAAAFAGAASKIAVVAALVRIDALPLPEVWHAGLALTGGASVVVGNLIALRQDGLARMLGYSSIGHAGFVAATLASGAPDAGAAALFYIAVYAPALLAALCVAGALGPAAIDDLRGLVWRRPLAGGALALALVSLAGLPVSAGFFGKFAVFTALIEGGAWRLLALAVLGTALGAFTYLRYVATIFRRGEAGADASWTPPEAVLFAAASAATLVLGLRPDLLLVPLAAALP